MNTTDALDETTSSPPRSPTARLIGLDVARGLAVLGMIAVHAGAGGWPQQLAAGRAAALFAVLAGVSIALMSGGTRPHENLAAARVRIAVRAVLLFLLGLALSSLQVPAMVILAFYGVLFLVALPLLRLRAAALAALAAVLAVGGPLLSFALRRGAQVSELGYHPGFADLTSAAGLGKLVQGLLLTGAYPVLTWLPFLLAGMALGRLDLRAVRGRLVAAGAGLGLLGYGGSWLAMDVFGGREHLSALVPGASPQVLEILLSSAFGTTPTQDPVFLLSAAPHSGTPFEIVGATGVAAAVIGLCLLAERWVVLRPLAATGALALTAYTGHLLVLKAIGAPQPPLLWLVLAAAVVLVAAVWRRVLGRGPLERLLHRASIAPAKALS